MIVAEMFSQGPRPAAISLTVVVNWLANFAVGQSFPPLEVAIVGAALQTLGVPIPPRICLARKLCCQDRAHRRTRRSRLRIEPLLQFSMVVCIVMKLVTELCWNASTKLYAVVFLQPSSLGEILCSNRQFIKIVYHSRAS